jgi:hypothetical protein
MISLCFGGVYAEKVLCGPHPARSLFSKKRRSHFFDTQGPPEPNGSGGPRAGPFYRGFSSIHLEMAAPISLMQPAS